MERLQVCSRCIMDTTDPDIKFDDEGICSHCHRFDRVYSKRIIPVEEREEKLRPIIDKIKRLGKNKKYDCIIGVSGGVDSTYVALLAKQLGLRPLAVHFDNGWNSELSVSNIEKTLNKLDIDLFTFVVDWQEFKELQLSFLRASTPDSEIPTDHGIISILHKMAAKYNVQYILNGHNYASESGLPLKWGYGYFDSTYIKDVHKKFGSGKFKSYPLMTIPKFTYYNQVKRIKWFGILNYVDYNKDHVMNVLQRDLGWVYYGGKHYESIYTRFFQSYILPRKFNIDKRKAHLSALINSKQISRQAALDEMKHPIYPERDLENDKEYVIKKFGITDQEFIQIMNLEPKTFLDYKTDYSLFERLKKYKRFFNF